MGITRKEMKQTAKAGMRSARPRPVLVTLLFTLLTTGLSLVVPLILLILSGWDDYFYWMQQGYSIYEVMYYSIGTAGTTALVFANVLIGLFGMVVTFGYTGYTLRVSRNEDAGFVNLLDGFGLAGRVILLNILISLFTVLWSLLLVIPGIIAFYRYRMAIYILLDDTECGVLEAIRMSKTMMKGHKANLFVFDLSFLNWILPYVAIGIVGTLLKDYSLFSGAAFIYIISALVGLWVTPYFLTSQAVFYDAISDGEIRRRQRGGYSGPEVRF